MTLKALLSASNYPQLELSLLNAYPETASQISAIKQVYKKLLELPIHQSSMEIKIAAQTAHTLSLEVYGLDEGQELDLSFAPWTDWLSAKIHPDTLQQYDDYSIIIHCLLNMCSHGFDEEEIASAWHSYNKAQIFQPTVTSPSNSQ